MARATKRQLMQREDDIQAAIRENKRPAEFAADLASKHKCSESSIMRQYRDILRDLRAAQKEKRSDLMVELEMQTKEIQTIAVEKGLYKTALDSINLRAKIGGVYRDEKEEAPEAPPKPVFNFVKADNSVPLAVVPKDEDDDTGS